MLFSCRLLSQTMQRIYEWRNTFGKAAVVAFLKFFTKNRKTFRSYGEFLPFCASIVKSAQIYYKNPLGEEHKVRPLFNLPPLISHTTRAFTNHRS